MGLLISILDLLLILGVEFSYKENSSFYVPFSAYIKIVVVGVVSYSVIAFLQYCKVKKVSHNDALKNVE